MNIGNKKNCEGEEYFTVLPEEPRSYLSAFQKTNTVIKYFGLEAT